jgi:hypothetical protein
MRAASRSTSTQRSPEQLATAHAGGGSQKPGGVLAITLNMGQEGAELVGAPDLEFGGLDLRRVGGVGHVADDIAPAHGVLEHSMDEDVDVSDRLGRQATWPMTSA